MGFTAGLTCLDPGRKKKGKKKKKSPPMKVIRTVSTVRNPPCEGKKKMGEKKKKGKKKRGKK